MPFHGTLTGRAPPRDWPPPRRRPDTKAELIIRIWYKLRNGKCRSQHRAADRCRVEAHAGYNASWKGAEAVTMVGRAPEVST